jgi:hypothetical protein
MSDEVQEPKIIEEDGLVGGKPVLNKANQYFAELIATHKASSIPEAYTLAFPERSSSKWMVGNAYRLAKNPKIREYIDTIQQATRLQIALELPEAFERVKDLAQNAKQERVKLDANLEILDRGGMKAPQRVESLQIGIFGSLNPNEMRELLKSNLTKLEESKS